MSERYFSEPYQFIRPYRKTLWCHTVAPFLPAILRRQFKVARWEFRGLDRLQQSLDQRAGVLLAPNHSGFADPVVVALMGLRLRRYFFYMASWHLFKKGRWNRFKLRRVGAFSIFREGVDRDALRESVRILSDGERPLVVFPEGTWFRRNDRLGPLQDGVSLIARRAQRDGGRPIVVHPVALKYWCLEDPTSALEDCLSRIEGRLQWYPQPSLPLLQRITKLSEAFVSIKEIEHLGEPQPGGLDRRISHLMEWLLSRQEYSEFGKTRGGEIMDRIRNLLQFLMKRFQDPLLADAERATVERQIHNVFLCQVLYGHTQEYLEELPNYERITETVVRLEEDLTGRELRPARRGVVAEVGRPMSVDEYLDRPGEIVGGISRDLQSMLDRFLEEGPPASWNCPSNGMQSANSRGGEPAGSRNITVDEAALSESL